MKAKQKTLPSRKRTAGKIIKQLNEKKEQPVINQLRDLFKNKLKTVYWLEKQLLKSIPRVIKHTRSIELINALEIHLTVTHDQVRRIEAVFDSTGEVIGFQKCEVASELIKEIDRSVKSTAETIVRDAGIILAMQQVQHFNIALYGTLCSYAKTIGQEEAAAVLSNALEEEKESDRDLTQIAETFINPVAASGYKDWNKVTAPAPWLQPVPVSAYNLFYS